MPNISAMVLEGQDPETRINDVISSRPDITGHDLDLVNQGKAELLTKIDNENWEAPYVWNITWMYAPPQEAQETVYVDIIDA